jgi:hypothetical protein
VPFASEVVVIVNGPDTVIVTAASGMLTPLARICAVPGPTAVTGIETVANALPSGKKFATEDAVVTTLGLLELRTTESPADHGADGGPHGAGAESRSCRFLVVPRLMLTLGSTQVTVARTWTFPVAEPYPVAEAVMLAEPTFTPPT